MKVCPHCHKNIQDKTTVCPYCGKSVKRSSILAMVRNSSYRTGLIAGIVALVVLLSAGVYYANQHGVFAAKPSCYEQSQGYLSAFTPLFAQWTQANQQIHGLDKKEIDLVEFSLETVHDQIALLIPPQCAQEVQALFVSYMDATLNGYNAFMAGEPEAKGKIYLDNAAQLYEQYHTLVIKIFPEIYSSPASTP